MLVATTVREAIKMLEDAGWVCVRTKGDHRQFRKPGNPLVVTVPGALSKDLAPGTWADIRRKAGL